MKVILLTEKNNFLLKLDHENIDYRENIKVLFVNDWLSYLIISNPRIIDEEVYTALITLGWRLD